MLRELVTGSEECALLPTTAKARYDSGSLPRWACSTWGRFGRDAAQCSQRGRRFRPLNFRVR